MKNYHIHFWIDVENKIVQVIGVIYVRREQARQLELIVMGLLANERK